MLFLDTVYSYANAVNKKQHLFVKKLAIKVASKNDSNS